MRDRQGKIPIYSRTSLHEELLNKQTPVINKNKKVSEFEPLLLQKRNWTINKLSCSNIRCVR